MHMKTLFEQNGYVVFERLVSADACDELITRMNEIVFELENSRREQALVFSKSDVYKHSHLLQQPDQLVFTVEDVPLSTYPLSRALYKASPVLHLVDPVFKAFSHQSNIQNAVVNLGCSHPQIVQSQYLFKQPFIGSAVAYHQDATYFPRLPWGLWIALVDATLNNGCLSVIPGGHQGPLRAQYDGADGFRILDETPFDIEHAIFLPVPKGSAIALHGLLPHASGPNTSSTARPAYALHCQSPY